MNRRGFLRGLGALLAAPAIVKASSLMAISPLLAFGLGLAPIRAEGEAVDFDAHLKLRGRRLGSAEFRAILMPGLVGLYGAAYADLPAQWGKVFDAA